VHDRARAVQDAAPDVPARARARGARRSVPFPPRLGEPSEYALLACHISRTRCSTARRSASTARCAWRPSRRPR
jgi:hypothetical protein